MTGAPAGTPATGTPAIGTPAADTPATGSRAGGVPGVRGPGLRAGLRAVLAVAVPTALCLALGAFDLTRRSLWLDEGASVAIASQHGAALARAMAHDGGNMLGYYALLHVLIQLFGNGPVVIRLPSVLGGAATVALVALLARRLLGDGAALATGLLGAVSLPLVFAAQDARSYALMAAFVAGSFLASTALLDQEPGAGPPLRLWAAFVATSVLAAYMSFVALLALPAELLVAIWWRRSWRGTGPLLAASALVGAACVPLAVLATWRGSGQLFWVPRPGATIASQVAHTLASSALLPNFPLVASAELLLGTTAAILAVTAAGTVLGAVRSAPPAPAPPGAAGAGHQGPSLAYGSRRALLAGVTALAWLVVPVGIELAESLVAQPVLLPRNVLVSLPAVALLLAFGLTRHPLPGAAGALAVAALLVLRGLSLFTTFGVSPEDWRGATAYVVAHRGSTDCVAFYPSDGRMLFDYYLRRDTVAGAGLRPVLPTAPWGEVQPFVEDYASFSAQGLESVASRCPRLWLVASHQGDPSGPPVARRHYLRYLALLEALSARYVTGPQAVFGYSAPVYVTLYQQSRMAG